MTMELICLDFWLGSKVRSYWPAVDGVSFERHRWQLVCSFLLLKSNPKSAYLYAHRFACQLGCLLTQKYPSIYILHCCHWSRHLAQLQLTLVQLHLPIRSTYTGQITYWISNTWHPVQLVLIQARKDCRYLRWDLYWIRSRGLPTPYRSPCLPPPLYYLILMDLLNPGDVGFGLRWLHSSPAPGWLIFWVC